MKSLRTAAIIVCLGLVAAPAAAKDISKQVSTTTQWNAAFNKHDAKTITGYYSSDAMLLPPADATVRGTDGIQKFWQATFDAGFGEHTVDTISADATGDVAYQTGTWSAKGSDGKTYTGKFVKAMEREGGTWKTKVHTWNIVP